PIPCTQDSVNFIGQGFDFEDAGINRRQFVGGVPAVDRFDPIAGDRPELYELRRLASSCTIIKSLGLGFVISRSSPDRIPNRKLLFEVKFGKAVAAAQGLPLNRNGEPQMGHLRAMVEAELFSLSRRDIMGRRDQPSLDILNRLPNLIAKKVQGTGFPAGFAFRREQRLCWLRSERQDRAHPRRAPTGKHRNNPREGQLDRGRGQLRFSASGPDTANTKDYCSGIRGQSDKGGSYAARAQGGDSSRIRA